MRFGAHLKAFYDIVITQQRVLQPEAELNLYGKSDQGCGIGVGFSDVDMGRELRYEISQKSAPYIGVRYEEKLGGTAAFARRHGNITNDVRFVIGIRSRF